MKKNPLSKRLAFAVFALWIAVIGCNRWTTSVNEVRTESQAVEIISATSAKVQVEFAAGELTVQGGAENLMDADFRYNVDVWKPQVRYSENGAQGELIVSQPGSDQAPVVTGLINEWTLLFTNDVPLDLFVRSGAGNIELDLGSLNLTSLIIESGVGNTNVNLDGNWDHDVTASIQGGVGQLIVNLPADMGVFVDVDTFDNVSANGLIVAESGYVNKTYGTAPHTLTLKLEAGIGSVILTTP